jgi:uncharacterized protein YacL
MFCPRCGTQNELKQGYCRQCGQALSAVQLAVEGSADQSLEKLKASREWINAGSATLVVFTLIGLVLAIIGFTSNNLTFSNIALINLLMGLAIGLPLIFAGQVSLKRAARFLSKSQTETDHSALDQTQGPDKLLTSGLNAAMHGVQVQDSVTEHTTRNLKESERTHHKPS